MPNNDERNRRVTDGVIFELAQTVGEIRGMVAGIDKNVVEMKRNAKEDALEQEKKLDAAIERIGSLEESRTNMRAMAATAATGGGLLGGIFHKFLEKWWL